MILLEVFYKIINFFIVKSSISDTVHHFNNAYAHRLSVRTPGFHPGKRGSTPRGRAIFAPAYTPHLAGAASASLHQLGLHEGYSPPLLVKDKVLSLSYIASAYIQSLAGAASASLHQLGLRIGYMLSLFVKDKVPLRFGLYLSFGLVSTSW